MEEELRNVTRHQRKVNSALGRRLHGAANPRHASGSGFGLRRREGCRRGVDSSDSVSRRRESKREPASTAAYVEYASSKCLVDQCREVVIVPRREALGVIHLNEMRSLNWASRTLSIVRVPGARWRYIRRSVEGRRSPSDFSRETSVVGLMPSSLAAPSAP